MSLLLKDLTHNSFLFFPCFLSAKRNKEKNRLVRYDISGTPPDKFRLTLKMAIFGMFFLKNQLDNFVRQDESNSIAPATTSNSYKT